MEGLGTGDWQPCSTGHHLPVAVRVQSEGRLVVRKLLNFAAKAFFGGCLAVLGAGFAALCLVVGIWLLPGYSPIDEYIEQHVFAKPTGTPWPTLQPTPTGTLPQIRLWMTMSGDPNEPAISSLPAAQLPEVRVWASSEVSGEVQFQLWIAEGPMGTGEWGPPQYIRPSGEPVPVGRFATAMLAGEYVLEARIGETVVGKLIFTLTE